MTQNHHIYTPLFPAVSTKSKQNTVPRVLLTKGVPERKFRQIIRKEAVKAFEPLRLAVEAMTTGQKRVVGPARGKTSIPTTTRTGRGQMVRKMTVCGRRFE